MNYYLEYTDEIYIYMCYNLMYIVEYRNKRGIR